MPIKFAGQKAFRTDDLGKYDYPSMCVYKSEFSSKEWKQNTIEPIWMTSPGYSKDFRDQELEVEFCVV